LRQRSDLNSRLYYIYGVWGLGFVNMDPGQKSEPKHETKATDRNLSNLIEMHNACDHELR